jgi:hypothetical protein
MDDDAFGYAVVSSLKFLGIRDIFKALHLSKKVTEFLEREHQPVLIGLRNDLLLWRWTSALGGSFPPLVGVGEAQEEEEEEREKDKVVRVCVKDLREVVAGFRSCLGADLKRWQLEESDGMTSLKATEFLHSLDQVASNDPDVVLGLFAHRVHTSTFALLVLLYGVLHARTDKGGGGRDGGVRWGTAMAQAGLDALYCRLIARVHVVADKTKVGQAAQPTHFSVVPFGSIRANVEVCYSEWGAHNPMGFRLRDQRKSETFALRPVLEALERQLELPRLAHTLPPAPEDGAATTTTMDDMWVGDPNVPLLPPEPKPFFLPFTVDIVKKYLGPSGMMCLRAPTIKATTKAV